MLLHQLRIEWHLKGRIRRVVAAADNSKLKLRQSGKKLNPAPIWLPERNKKGTLGGGVAKQGKKVRNWHTIAITKKTARKLAVAECIP